MTNGQLAAIAALITRRASIWTHQCLAIDDPFAAAPENSIRQLKADVLSALLSLDRQSEPRKPA